MLAELRSILSEGVTWLEAHCLSYGGLPSWPFVAVLRRWLGVELETQLIVRTRARARLGPLFGDDPSNALPGLARLLRVQLLQERSSDDETTVRHAYVAWIETLAANGPVVLALDDLHWAHASTRELAATNDEIRARRTAGPLAS